MKVKSQNSTCLIGSPPERRKLKILVILYLLEAYLILPSRGLEPLRLAARGPKPRVSAYFTTRARVHPAPQEAQCVNTGMCQEKREAPRLEATTVKPWCGVHLTIFSRRNRVKVYSLPRRSWVWDKRIRTIPKVCDFIKARTHRLRKCNFLRATLAHKASFKQLCSNIAYPFAF